MMEALTSGERLQRIEEIQLAIGLTKDADRSRRLRDLGEAARRSGGPPKEETPLTREETEMQLGAIGFNVDRRKPRKSGRNASGPESEGNPAR